MSTPLHIETPWLYECLSPRQAVICYFVQLSSNLAEHLPEYARYFGIAMMLKRGMYGGTPANGGTLILQI
jgi:hypothetical protein